MSSIVIISDLHWPLECPTNLLHYYCGIMFACDDAAVELSYSVAAPLCQSYSYCSVVEHGCDVVVTLCPQLDDTWMSDCHCELLHCTISILRVVRWSKQSVILVTWSVVAMSSSNTFTRCVMIHSRLSRTLSFSYCCSHLTHKCSHTGPL